MPDATKRPVAEWRETEWLQHLLQQAQQLTACPQSAADLAHTCLIAFYDHHRCHPWQHHEPAHALRWCCQKLRALACDAHRYAQRHPCLALDTLPESVACVDIAPQVQADTDGERFVASLPPRLRAAVELRLAGYSWDEAAQQLGVSASTLVVTPSGSDNAYSQKLLPTPNMVGQTYRHRRTPTPITTPIRKTIHTLTQTPMRTQPVALKHTQHHSRIP